MNTTTSDVGKFLEDTAKSGDPITYTQVITRFPDLPAFTGAWLSHPLCTIFGELDQEDFDSNRPLRTALVFAKETGMPGQGFFDTISDLRGQKISKADQTEVWIAELNAVKEFYK